MSLYQNNVQFQTLQTLSHSSIGTSFSTVGNPFSNALRMFRLINNTDADMIFTTSSVDSTGQFFVPAGSYVLYDVTTNSGFMATAAVQANTQFYVKYSTAPSKNAVWIEGVS